MSTRYNRSLTISGGFVLLVLWFWSVNGWRLTAAVLSAAALHELGHWSVLKLMGGRGTALHLSVFGAEMQIAGNLSYGQELAVILGGPGVNLLLGGALTLFGESLFLYAGAHLVLGLFNLLPIRPLDGGRMVQLAAAWLAGPAAGECAVRWIGGCAAAAGAAFLMWLMWRSGGSLWLLPAAVGMLLTARKEVGGKDSFL